MCRFVLPKEMSSDGLTFRNYCTVSVKLTVIPNKARGVAVYSVWLLIGWEGHCQSFASWLRKVDGVADV
jgi:hypothetical protein